MNDATPAAVQEKPSRPVRWTALPPGQVGVPCRYNCGKIIYFSAVNPKTGKKQPVDLSHAGSVAPTSTTWGQGVAHWANCPAARADALRRRQGL